MSEFEEFIDISFCAGTTKVNIASVKIYFKCVCVYIYIYSYTYFVCVNMYIHIHAHLSTFRVNFIRAPN